LERNSFSYFFQHRLPQLLLWVLPLLFFAYTATRAVTVSLTHDECGSFRAWTDFNIFQCHYLPDCWSSANLHWLYVLLMQPAVHVFGNDEWAIRLPALLGHSIYLYFSFRLIKWSIGERWEKEKWLAVFGFILLNINPYLLDFFSLARGYGLAMAMMMGSLFYLAKWTENKNRKYLFGLFLFSLLAILSNFTLLNYYACMVALIAIFLLSDYFYRENRNRQRIIDFIGFTSFFSLLIYWLLRQPISFLKDNGEFEWGANSFWDTFHSTVKNSLYGVSYFKMYNVEIFGGLLILFLIFSIWKLISENKKEQINTEFKFGLIAVFFPTLVSLSSIVQYYLLGSKFLINRTALLYIPLCALSVFFLSLISSKNGKWIKWPMALIGIFCIVHLLKSHQFDSVQEWKYDANTREAIEYISKKIPEDEKVKLGVHWFYHPSARYYVEKMEIDFLEEPLKYSKAARSDLHYDYYYISSDVLPQVNKAYQVEKEFGDGNLLLRSPSSTRFID